MAAKDDGGDIYGHRSISLSMQAQLARVGGGRSSCTVLFHATVPETDFYEVDVGQPLWGSAGVPVESYGVRRRNDVLVMDKGTNSLPLHMTLAIEGVLHPDYTSNTRRTGV